MPREQELSDRENKRLRTIARKQLEKAGSQTKLAEQLGIHQTVLSKFLGEKVGASYDVARRLAELEGRHLVSILGEKSLEVPGAVNVSLLAGQIGDLGRGLTRLMELVEGDDQRNPALRHQLAAVVFTWQELAASLMIDPDLDDETRAQLLMAAGEGRRLAEQEAAAALKRGS